MWNNDENAVPWPYQFLCINYNEVKLLFPLAVHRVIGKENSHKYKHTEDNGIAQLLN